MSQAIPQVLTVVDRLGRIRARGWFVCMYIQPSVARAICFSLP